MNRTFTKEQLLFDNKFRDDFELGRSIKAVKQGRILTKIGMYVSDFDDLTPADCVFLQLCRSNCDLLLVSIPSDYSMRQNGKSPRFPLSERIFRLGSLYCVDYVAAFDEETCSLSVDKVDPDFIFYGRTDGDDSALESLLSTQKQKLKLIEYPWREERKEGRFFSL